APSRPSRHPCWGHPSRRALRALLRMRLGLMLRSARRARLEEWAKDEGARSMRVSAGLPTGMEGLTYPIPFSDPENVIKIAQAAEKFGYDSVWGNDHMTTQNYVRAEFPVPPRFWEPLITYAFVLSETRTIKVGTGVIVLPMRHDIVVLAKQIATLDHFGKGRLEIGVGIGAYREEFKALQPESKLQRGDIVDEGLQALKLL